MLATSNQPDVILMDINLEGGREGIEVAKWLHKVCEAPIVFVTGYTDRDIVAHIHEQVPGAAVLPKPVIVIGLPRRWRQSIRLFERHGSARSLHRVV